MEHLFVMHYEEKLDTFEHALIDHWISLSNENNELYRDTIFIWKNAWVAQHSCSNKELAWEKLNKIVCTAIW